MKYNSQSYKNLCATALCFICTMLIIKIIDFESVETFSKSAAHCLVVSGFIALIVLAIHFLISLFSEKCANWTSSIILAIIMFSEAGLTIYTNHSGQLMSKELFIRPVSEIMQTIIASISLFLLILSVIGAIGGFLLLTHFARKKLQGKWTSIAVTAIIALSVPSIFFIDTILDSSKNIEARNHEVCKVWFMAKSNFNIGKKLNNENIEYNEQLINEFLADNPCFVVPDKHYPLERIDNTQDVLGQYFNSSTKPDIVIIVIESLGNEMMNGFSPFIDSLAHQSLYWPNCLSTTTRSYGAVPAITASVIGPKGFQFGIMPEHNSLLKILKSNGYQTNAFYGGDFGFDCISEYLIAQGTDYMSDYYNEYQNGDQSLGNWWGYFDHVMFDRSFEKIKNDTTPMFNLLITITNHEALNIKDEAQEMALSEQADKIIAKMDTETAAKYSKNKMRYCTMLYTDDCVRKFINKYREHPNFRNTIFVITGDHSSGLIIKNNLSYHHVPLIIWSPLLKKTKTFASVVTHNDITPSLTALLRDKYHLNTPELVHWIGNGLDTTSQMRIDKRMVHVNYNREMREIIYGNYLYWAKSQWENEQANEITQSLDLKRIDSDSLKSFLNDKLELYKYICRYTYHNNRLTQHPVLAESGYRTLKNINKITNMICTTPDKMPSEVGTKKFKLFSDTDTDRSISKIKVTLNANVFINDSLWQDKYMDLVIECTDKETNTKTEYVDKITKFIKSDIIQESQWYDLSVSKEFVVSKDSEHSIAIYISSVRYDDQWVGGSSLTIGKRTAKIEVK